MLGNFHNLQRLPRSEEELYAELRQDYPAVAEEHLRAYARSRAAYDRLAAAELREVQRDAVTPG